jgi:alpha-L-rhamnosidase
VLAALVWNFGYQRPEAQISFRTAFILQGNTDPEKIVNTDKTWKCIRDNAYSPLKPELAYAYYVAGPGPLLGFGVWTWVDSCAAMISPLPVRSGGPSGF